MRIAIVTDAWHPQVNGVVRTLQTTVNALRAGGHELDVLTPDQFASVPCPGYPEIRLALGAGRAVASRLRGFAPDAIHVATEGPLGWAARGYCLRGGKPFSTSFHTRFPEYVAMRTGMPAKWIWPVMRRFHGRSDSIMVATETLARELADQGLTRTHRWSRGVDLELFSPGNPPLPEMLGLPGPVQLYVGRVAVEKNIEAFLNSDTPGSKVVIGDGPARAALALAFPDALFLGARHGQALASAYATADVLVFPSRTDTFGLVMVEALASGTPVAAYPVPGPLDILADKGRALPVGAMDDDIGAATMRALTMDRGACAAEGRRYDWGRCTQQFLAGLRVDASAIGEFDVPQELCRQLEPS